MFRPLAALTNYNENRKTEEDSGMSFKEITKTDQFADGTMKGFELDGQPVLVANIEGKFYAMRGKCTHMGGELAKGKLDGKVVTCPRHGSRFDVTSGKALSGPKIGFLHLNTADEPAYPVKVEGTSLQVDLG
jgi:3-phenylpropionate/trans-cinnamate dioxygenase ferredoxin component